MWTTERPTKAGWYRFRVDRASSEIDRVYVMWEYGKLVTTQGDTVSEMHGEWQPVQGPRE